LKKTPRNTRHDLITVAAATTFLLIALLAVSELPV